MFDIEAILRAMPHFETFCSVARLNALTEQLRSDDRFAVTEIGRSRGDIPIQHIRFGSGKLKALVVGGPHAMEPIGGLTVYALLTLLAEGEPSLCAADVEWHIVPCVDPDGAVLNEGWTLAPYDIQNYIRHFYVQPTSDMVDTSFPVRHKKLVWEEPSHEAAILQRLIDETLPDFYYGLHNAWIGGTFYFVSRDLGVATYAKLYELLEREGLPLQRRPLWKEVCKQYGPGVVEMIDVTKHYDYVERTSPEPDKLVEYGASSRFHLTRIKPEAVTFVTEMGYVRHSDDESEAPTGRNMRRFLLEMDAANKHLAAIFLEEWDKVEPELDRTSPFYRAIVGGMVMPLDKDKILAGGMPMSWYPTRDALFSSSYDREMTKADAFNIAMINSGAMFLRHCYQFIRLLDVSPPTEAVAAARARAGAAFDEAMAEIGRHVDFDAFTAIDCDTLARVQLGSGLIALQTLLDERAGAPGPAAVTDS